MDSAERHSESILEAFCKALNNSGMMWSPLIKNFECFETERTCNRDACEK